MSTVAITVEHRVRTADQEVVTFTVAWTGGTYTTGGVALDAGQILDIFPDGTPLDDIAFRESEFDVAGNHPVLDRGNKKVLLFDVDSEVNNGTDLSAVVSRLRVTKLGANR